MDLATPEDISGSVRLNRVVVSGSALMRILRHGAASMPELCAGGLVGVDDDDGTLHVSGAFALPAMTSKSSSQQQSSAFEEEETAQVNIGTETTEEDIQEYQQEMLRLLKEVRGDDLSVGWYRTVNMGDYCTTEVVEQQFARQEELDQQCGKAKSVLLVLDPYQTEGTQTLSLKALRLTDAFMDLMRARTSPDARVTAASDAALSQFKMSDVFYEIPVEIESLTQSAASSLRDLMPAKEQLDDELESDFDRLVLAPEPYLEKNVQFVSETLEALQAQQAQSQYHVRQVAKQKLLQVKFIAARKAENALRAERGEDPLPLRDNNDPAFKPLKDASKLDSLLIRKQISLYCGQINGWTAGNFEKLFVASAVVQKPIGSSSTQTS